MIDQCKNCTARGNISLCMDAPCSVRESWYAQKLRAENEKLAKLLAQEREWQWQSRKTLVAHLSAALKVANGETEQ